VRVPGQLPKRRKFEPNDPHAEGWEVAAAEGLRTANPYGAYTDDARRWTDGYNEYVETEDQCAD